MYTTMRRRLVMRGRHVWLFAGARRRKIANRTPSYVSSAGSGRTRVPATLPSGYAPNVHANGHLHARSHSSLAASWMHLDRLISIDSLEKAYPPTRLLRPQYLVPNDFPTIEIPLPILSIGSRASGGRRGIIGESTPFSLLNSAWRTYREARKTCFLGKLIPSRGSVCWNGVL